MLNYLFFLCQWRYVWSSTADRNASLDTNLTQMDVQLVSVLTPVTVWCVAKTRPVSTENVVSYLPLSVPPPLPPLLS